MLINFSLHFLKPSSDWSQFRSSHRFIKDLLTVSLKRQEECTVYSHMCECVVNKFLQIIFTALYRVYRTKL